MVAIQERFPRFTPEEYLAWEEQQDLKYEYVGGEVRAMTGGTINHGRIAVSFMGLLIPHLQGGSCLVLNSDVKVSIKQCSDYVYPDISVTCDERDRTATNFISYPCLIVEVLSPSTKNYDRWDKFNLYRRSDSLIDYVLVSSDAIEIVIYHRNDRGKWEIATYGVGDLVVLESVDLSFSIEQIYGDIVFS
jgi:Uma2 family endonuclease